MIVIIDNHGSFAYNLYQYLGEADPDIVVIRSDTVTVQELEKLPLSGIVLCSGAELPEDKAASNHVVTAFAGKVPILGVGFGHLAIAKHFSCAVVPAKRVIHGKCTLIYHQGDQIFHGIKSPLEVMCYHSLVVDPQSLPDELQVLAVTYEAEVMAIRHRRHLVFGLQFCPGSIATECGKQLLHNFLNHNLLGGGSCVA
ncbi:MAG: aminodeoxychorismate/anthranilate synthase component II [Firmicutes bacterium]|jgi:anthranilate synthase/aminodeoxychorismate synthase-like glutamine amidotransferase|nr:aminodeoxychorismate/anthranilate synthase component II [Bacillota bacterium]NLL88603.1 aminodeoxychorismate/anthranilate synthase component II [Bacillota bacterium]